MFDGVQHIVLYEALGTISSSPPPSHPTPPRHTRLTTAALWRRGQVKSWWPCGERWARSVCGEGLLRIWSMIWLGVAVMRRDLYMKAFIYMFQNISLLSRFPRDADTQNNMGSVLRRRHIRRAACSRVVVFTFPPRNDANYRKEHVNAGWGRNGLHKAIIAQTAVQSHHYAPTSVNTILLNITMVRYWTCWRSAGSESPLSKPEPWSRTVTAATEKLS